MNEGRTSPKRRHILSSINPEDSSHVPRRHRPAEHRTRSATPPPPPHSSREKRARDGDDAKDPEDGGDTTRPRRGRLKLKGDRSSRSHRSHRSSRRHRSRERRDDDDDDDKEQESRRDRHHHRSQDPRANHDENEGSSSGRRGHHHPHRRRRRGRSRSPTPPNPHEPEPLDPEAAFRASLFDAMADDEGAAYWEGVYGQPVHVYEQDKVGPQGELERMTDDEYAAHVRQRMWEKTHAGLLEERARREARRRQKEDEARHDARLRAEMERSLRRGEARRERRLWARRWEDYAAAWDAWDGAARHMAWPWEGGAPRRPAGWGVVGDGPEEEVDEAAVRAFFVHGLAADELGEDAFAARLRDERVRWHPDKMQQRLGGKVDDKIMRDVTAIFQIIDRLWAEMRKKE